MPRRSKSTTQRSTTQTDPQGQVSQTEVHEVTEREHPDTRRARATGGMSLSAPQMSITVAFSLILAGIVAKRHWMQNFLQWTRK